MQMLQKQPETPVAALYSGRPTVDFSPIRDINREFLRVLTRPAVQGRQHLLGLESPVLDGLCSLSTCQLDEIAAVPHLLAEFSPVPDAAAAARISAVQERSPPFESPDNGWDQEVHAFTDRLLTCLWQSARHDTLLAAFCVGPNEDIRRSMAQLSFTKISRYSDQAYRSLRARLSSHPRFWPDLIRAARSGSTAQQHASQLSIIQLSVAALVPRPTTRSTSPKKSYAS
jgi:hypothetical protein